MEKRKRNILHASLLVIVLSLALIGTLLYGVGKAATHATAVESEAAVLSGNATILNDARASAGKAVHFGSSINAIINSNFDNLAPAAPASISDFRSAVSDSSVGAQSNMVNTSIVAVSGRGNVIRQTLPANTFGGSNGITIASALLKAVDEASIQYDIKFDDNFDWSWGGKLPGLGGAVAGTSPYIAAGCASGNDQVWSGRGMWITPGSYGSVTGSNELIGYMYNFNKTSACGDNIRTSKAFTTTSWHTIKQYYKLNTPGQADGIHRMWLDGNMVVNNSQYIYRNTAALHINYMFWSIFRGGNTIEWAGAHNDYIDIDNLLVTTP